MSVSRRWLPAAVAILLVVAAALLALGVSLEGGADHDRDATTVSEAEESPLGLPLESTGAVAALVVVSLALAVAVWRRPVPLVLGAIAGFAVVAGVLDVVEVSHQFDTDRPGLAVLALVIATTRLMVLLGTIRLWRTTPAAPRRSP
jgi:hypothetical protein